MFTGIVEGTGRVEGLDRQGAEARLRVSGGFLGTLRRGASVAVDGVCLTAVDAGPGWFEAGVSSETLSRTTLGLLGPGRSVNLERPLGRGDRLGGHLVQGHVDAVGVVTSVKPEGTGARVRIAIPRGLGDLIVMKGSVAVDGISLTVAAREAGWFEVALIPETLSVTGAGGYREGTPVNLEVDIIGRYVVEHLKRREQDERQAGQVTREHLARHGFGGTEEAP